MKTAADQPAAAERAAALVRRSPLELAHLVLLQRIASLRVPRIVGQADGKDLRDLSDHLIEAMDAMDAYVAAIGAEAAGNSPKPFDRSLFDKPCFKAVEGNALHELAEAATAIDEELTEVL
jgi:hypothetical protein